MTPSDYSLRFGIHHNILIFPNIITSPSLLADSIWMSWAPVHLPWCLWVKLLIALHHFVLNSLVDWNIFLYCQRLRWWTASIISQRRLWPRQFPIDISQHTNCMDEWPKIPTQGHFCEWIIWIINMPYLGTRSIVSGFPYIPSENSCILQLSSLSLIPHIVCDPTATPFPKLDNYLLFCLGGLFTLQRKSADSQFPSLPGSLYSGRTICSIPSWLNHITLGLKNSQLKITLGCGSDHACCLLDEFFSRVIQMEIPHMV